MFSDEKLCFSSELAYEKRENI